MSQTGVVGQEIGHTIRQLIPSELLPVFFVITFFGGVGFLLVAFTLDYWFLDAKRGAHSLGVAVAGAGLVVALKAFFGEPRPSVDVAAIPASGFAFPSGHATMSTVAYGLLAYDLRKSTWRVRFAAAAVVVSLISLSRVVLGVHYVRDVVAGVLFGSLFLLGGLSLTKHVPRKAFWLAAAVGTVALAVSGGSGDGLAVFGASVGGALTWELLDGYPSVGSRRGRAVLVVGVLPLLAVVGYVATRLSPPPVAVVILAGVVTSAILSAPKLVKRVA
ncbi:PAP2 superfamily protein [Halopelagius inordinatus]|uniref:PAP2 superfamily protein n=1 Tax=Halopelagius inordinatus TaxID=553467 RepID=A0A1I2SNI6_9EURY|nr:phosphatase PAP2 family protein [Halopelagius inordinatus]SFG51471.1 PAP2 superfamily protein [Halopelagius inordinatus]